MVNSERSGSARLFNEMQMYAQELRNFEQEISGNADFASVSEEVKSQLQTDQ